jgi:competence protein ComEC
MAHQLQLPVRAPALLLLGGTVLGLSLTRWGPAPIGPALGLALGLAIGSYFLARRHRALWLISFWCAATVAFWAYGSLRLPLSPSLEAMERPPRELRLAFDLERVLNPHNAFGKATGFARVARADPTGVLSPGDRFFFRLTLPEEGGFAVLRGSRLAATAVLSPIHPEVSPDSFDGYLKDSGIHYRFARNDRLTELRPPGWFDRFAQATNQRFEGILRLAAPPERGLDDIYVAMLLGQKIELSPEQKERFRMTGTMHFFAISGLHIGVIATVIAQFLLIARVPRRWSPFIGLPLVYLYVEITGAPPSAVRAFLMVAFFWISFALARQRSPLAALAASAVFVLIVQPAQLWSLGFQLSYTVVLSLLLMGLPLHGWICQRATPRGDLPEADWSRWQRWRTESSEALGLMFAISFSAWLASAPLSAAFFGYLSPWAILLNMCLVNLAALAISSGVLALALGMLGLEALSGFINHAAWLTLALMDGLVAWSAAIPGLIFQCPGFPRSIAYGTLLLYFASLFWMHRQPQPQKAAYWALPVAVIGGGLLLGLALMP